MEKTCPHCGFGVREMWHHRYGIQKLGEGWVEARVPVVGVVRVRRETLVMGHVCDLTEEPSKFEGKSNGEADPGRFDATDVRLAVEPFLESKV